MIPLEPLTAREKEALALLMQGLTSKEAAEGLSISRRTLEDYRANILKKYGVKKIVQVARLVSGEDVPVPAPAKAALMEVLRSVKAMQEQLQLIETRVQYLLHSDLEDQRLVEVTQQAQVPQRRQRRRVRFSPAKRY